VAPLPVIALMLALAGPHGQPSADEQRLFAEGAKAFDAGDARGAERAWKEGYALAHDPAFLVRIGEAQEKAGASAEAVESYRRYLREAPDASDRADIEQRISRLAPAPAGAPAERTEAPHDFGSGPAPSLPTGPAPAAPGASPGVADAESGRPGADEEDSGWNAYNVTAMVATGATVLLLGTAAIFGAQASSKEGDANRLLTFRDENGVPLTYTPDVAHKYEQALADGRRDDRNAKIALLGAAGTAAVAAIFFVLDGLKEPAGQVAVAPAPGGGVAASAAWSWRF
jgi:hypothetical protein